MAAPGFRFFGDDAAHDFIAALRKADPGTVGDSISAALRAVAQAEQPLTSEQVSRALVALSLLLSEFEPEILAGAPAEDALRSWFGKLEIELNPARRQVAAGAIDRILLPADNDWYRGFAKPADRAEALAEVHRLRDRLADSAVDA
jgi:hypothetical protein